MQIGAFSSETQHPCGFASGAGPSNTGPAAARSSVAVTDLDARHRRALPTIIAGDFNAAPDAASIRYLTGRRSLQGRSVHYHDAWAIAGEGPGYTWTVDNPNASTGIDKSSSNPITVVELTTCS